MRPSSLSPLRTVGVSAVGLIAVTLLFSGFAGFLHQQPGSGLVRILIGVAMLAALLKLLSTTQLLSSYALVIYAALFGPIVVVVAFAFNAGTSTSRFTGVSLRWFESAAGNPAIHDAVFLSVRIAVASALLSVVLGTAAAISLVKLRLSLRVPYEAVMFLTLVIPELMIAIGLLLFFVRFGFSLGPTTMMIGHTIFGASLVTLIVRARYVGMGTVLEIASADLGATPRATFWQITLPRLGPAMAVGLLLAFTFSFDDVVVSQFTSGSGSTTWPLYIYSALRFGVKPDVNATATMMLFITIAILGAAGLFYLRMNKQTATLTTP